MACAALRLPRVRSSQTALSASPLRSAQVYKVVLLLLASAMAGSSLSSPLRSAQVYKVEELRLVRSGGGAGSSSSSRSHAASTARRCGRARSTRPRSPLLTGDGGRRVCSPLPTLSTPVQNQAASSNNSATACQDFVDEIRGPCHTCDPAASEEELEERRVSMDVMEE